MREAKTEKMWFEKSKKPSEVYWLYLLKTVTWESANMYIAPRGRHNRSAEEFNGEGVKIEVRNGKLHIKLDSVKTNDSILRTGYFPKDAPEHKSPTFNLDEFFYPEKQPPYGRITILAKDINGTKWDFTLYPENGR